MKRSLVYALTLSAILIASMTVYLNFSQVNEARTDLARKVAVNGKVIAFETYEDEVVLHFDDGRTQSISEEGSVVKMSRGRSPISSGQPAHRNYCWYYDWNAQTWVAQDLGGADGCNNNNCGLGRKCSAERPSNQ